MKYITKYKSPNYNSRKNSKISLIIIHYTALQKIEDAINYLCKKEKKVSSHYLISQNGSVYHLVDNKFRAWHAGEGFWQENTDINSVSIGIELDYSPNGKNNHFSLKMINSLKKLLIKLKKKYKISKKNILAHSDIAPFRKKDPGKNFPWKSLKKSNILLNFRKLRNSDLEIIEEWFNINNFKSKKRKIIFSLSLIGYDTREVVRSPRLYYKLINAYKIRYVNNIDKKNELFYDTLIKHLFNFMLTKN